MGLLAATPAFARGIIFGGLIVTINFHLLAKTLKKALHPQAAGFPQRDPGQILHPIHHQRRDHLSCLSASRW
jgi:hypothetical protein